MIVTRASTFAVKEQGFVLGCLALSRMVNRTVLARPAVVTSPGLGSIVGVGLKSCEYNVLHLLCC
jgi:hypothetical protein